MNRPNHSNSITSAPLKILQANLHKCFIAQAEFLDFFSRHNYDIGIISEPYIGNMQAIRSYPGLTIFQFPTQSPIKAALLVRDRITAFGLRHFSSSNLSIMQLQGVSFVSIYVEPVHDEYATLDKLDTFLQATSSPCIVGGDFNGHHVQWQSPDINTRGTRVADLFTTHDLTVLNIGNTPTFQTTRQGTDISSIVDLTATSPSLADKISNWQVDFRVVPTSDHNGITFSLNLGSRPSPLSPPPTSTFLYRSDTADWGTFDAILDLEILQHFPPSISFTNSSAIDEAVEAITTSLQLACQASMQTKGTIRQYKAPWWTDELYNMRRLVSRQKRKIHRKKQSGTLHPQDIATLNTLKEDYRVALQRTSFEHFKVFCTNQGQADAFTITNRLIQTRHPASSPATILTPFGHTTDAATTAKGLLDAFFPLDDSTTDSPEDSAMRACMMQPASQLHDDVPFSTHEVLTALSKTSGKKAPGHDHLTADVCLRFARTYTTLLTNLLNACLTVGYYPTTWKHAVIKVLPKPGRSWHTSPADYRPIGLLPVLGKLLERLFILRINHHLAKNNQLNPRQYGFRPQTSTLHALHDAISHIKTHKAEKQQVAAASLDMEAAFQSAWWPAIISRLRHLQCPGNLITLLVSYFRDRQASLHLAGHTITVSQEKGCVQGSACGPSLWNILIDLVLDIPLPDSCRLQAFADDLLLIAHAPDSNTLQSLVNDSLNLLNIHLTNVRLSLNPNKTNIVVFTKPSRHLTFTFNGASISPSPTMKLLGVIIDQQLNFKSHLDYAIQKGHKIFQSLRKLAYCTWGLHSDIINLLYRQVVEPTVLYGAEIWGKVAEMKTYQAQLASFQRLFALKAIKAYRTVSTNAALALAQFPPIHLKISEMMSLFRVKVAGTGPFAADDVYMEQPVPPRYLHHPADYTYISFDRYTDQAPLDDLPGLHLYTDGSKSDIALVGAAFVAMQNNIHIVTRKFKLHPVCSVFQAELLAIKYALIWLRNTSYDTATICSDSLSSLLALSTLRSPHPLIHDIWSALLALKIQGTSVRWAWVKGHANITGNEAADSAAKAACNLRSAPLYDDFPYSYAKCELKKLKHQSWQQEYTNQTTGSHTKAIFPQLSMIKKFRQKLPAAFFQTQLLTGHGCHKQYLHRFHIVPDNTCPCDGVTVQSLNHLIQDCPRFATRRHYYSMTCGDPSLLTIKNLSGSSLDNFVDFATHILTALKAFNGV